MRLERISASWFRGAAESASLELGGKSAVVYGSNGSGKSTFADAIEWLIRGGKINHLAHEYSGPGQRHGVRNTHAPQGSAATARLEFTDGGWVEGELTPEGKSALRGSDEARSSEVVKGWNPWTVLLRQDEVSGFVHATKGEKYSVLLPLLGLGDLEQAADNLRRLSSAVRKEGALQAKEARLAELEMEVGAVLDGPSDDSVLSRLQALGQRYVDTPRPENPADLVRAVEAAIEDQISHFQPEHDRHRALGEIQSLKLSDRLRRLKAASESLRTTADEMLERRVALLEEAERYAGCLEPELGSIECPVCGAGMDADDLAAHVAQELTAVREAREHLEARDEARGALARGLDHFRRVWATVDVSGAAEGPSLNELAQSMAAIKLDGDELTDAVERLVGQIELGVNALARNPPAELDDLLSDRRAAEACHGYLDMVQLQAEAESIRSLASLVDRAEATVRAAISDQSSAVMEQISCDVQRLWAKLHPDEPVENVQLYSPDGASKAIDIALKFFGVDQNSPRLTLSEGHRNSLGLCIFFAMAAAESRSDRPIVLDDIVTSLDREHRGMLVRVLEQDLAERQVILLTHDREWYSELRRRLPPKTWTFHSLRPWQTPAIGLEWSTRQDTLDDALAKAGDSPEAAGNLVRRVMDNELAIVAEKLKVPLPYRRGDANDQRTCIEFLGRIGASGKKSFKRRHGDEKEWNAWEPAFKAWQEAYDLLVVWGNRASHTGTLTKSEVIELVDVCRVALATFKCEDCEDYVWLADQTKRERLQCGCGRLQWRY